MKRAKLILWSVIIIVSVVCSLVYARDYVCIDPGHGGKQSGTVGRVYGVLEKNVNLGVGLIVCRSEMSFKAFGHKLSGSKWYSSLLQFLYYFSGEKDGSGIYEGQCILLL
jgi:hypothetical protein